jgi:hypothetical protein
MAAADFTINGTPHGNLGYDAEHDEVLELALDAAPGLDVERVKYSIVVASLDAPELAFDPANGIPTNPTDTVTVTMPSSGVHTYEVQCQVNEGRDAAGRTNRDYTRRRIVTIRSPNLGLRKLVPGETTEYSAIGWTEEQNRAVELLDTYGLGGSEFQFPDGITFPADGNYSITQARAEDGTAPGAANLKAQSAPSDEAVDGAPIRLSGGDPGAVGNLGGGVVTELGPAVGDTTAPLSVQMLGSEIMRLLRYNGTAAVRAAGSLVLQLYSSTRIVLQTTICSASLTEAGREFGLAFVKRFTMDGGQRQVLPAGGSSASGTLNLDFDVSEKWSYTLTGNATFAAPTNVLSGATYTIKLTQDGTGNRTASWNSVFKFGSLSGTLSTAAGAVDIFVFEGSPSGNLHCILASKGVHV